MYPEDMKITVCERALTEKWYVQISTGVAENRRVIKVYTGKKFGMPGGGNNAKTITARRAYFYALQTRVQAAVLSGQYKPFTEVETIVTLAEAGRIVNQICRSYRPKCSTHIEQVSRAFIRHHGHPTVPVDAVTRKQVQAFLDSLTVGNTTYNNYRRDLVTFFNILVQREIIQDNPAKGIKKRRQISVQNVAYTPDELRQVVAACAEAGRAMHLCAALMMSAFLRPNEIRLLQRKHINFESGILSAPPDIRKTGDTHTVELPGRVIEIMRVYAIPDLPASYFITSGNATPFAQGYFAKSFQRRVKPRLVRQGVITRQHTLYSIRHAAACMYYEKTKDVKGLQQLFGHRYLETTDTYLRSLGLYTKKNTPDDLDLPGL